MKFAEQPSAEITVGLQARAHADLDVLERQFADQQFVLGDQFSMADIACSAYLQYADETALDLRRWPAVETWLGRIAAIPGVEHPYILLSPDRAT